MSGFVILTNTDGALSPVYLNSPTLNESVTVSGLSTGVVHSSSTGLLTSSLIVTGDISNNVVTTDKIADSNVTTIKINDNAVTTVKIDSNAVTSAKINDNAITTVKIDSNAVTSAKINDNAITTAKIDSNAVTTAKINDNAIITSKIDSNAVTSAKLALDISYNGILKVVDCTVGSVNTQTANKGYVDKKVSDLVGLTAPASLDTLSEIATAIADSNGNPVFPLKTNVDASFNLKANLAGPTFTGTVSLSGLNSVGVVHNNASGNLSTSLIVAADITNATITSAKLASNLDLSGNPTAPTQTAGNNSTRIATTEFVTQAISDASNNISISGITITNNKTSLGTDALKNNSSGLENTAIGFEALKSNTTGSRNTSFGFASLKANTTGNNNIALGANVLTLNTTGADNIAIGYNALIKSIVNIKNIAIGSNTLTSTISDGNVAIGDECLFSNTNGYNNVAIGRNTMRANTVGGNGVAIGASALQNNTIGQGNTALGNNALFNNTEGTLNVALGTLSLYENTTGNDNTAIGYKSGYTAKNLTNLKNTYIGSNSDIDSSASSWSTSTAIGYNSKITASNQITLGTSSETVRIPKLNSVGVVHTNASGDLSTSLIVNADINDNAVSGSKLTLDISYNGILKVVDCSGGSVNQVANKGYVDSQISAGGSSSNFGLVSNTGELPTNLPPGSMRINRLTRDLYIFMGGTNNTWANYIINTSSFINGPYSA